MRGVDYSPFYRSIVGFDRLANLIDAASKAEPSNGYPPYNIEQLGENDYRIELAVAGFGDEDLFVEVQENVLTVSGRKAERSEDEAPNYLYRGIAERAFERRFHLADHVSVTGAELKNGLLLINLEREIPEAAKPRRIEIGSTGSKAKTIEGRKSKAA
ncbi:Hsp20 family protein [Hyphobacterium sp. SN044]|uniref:Hsp20 family protein n=1 Tax=Hyphobacterium sp. SN044 TaxID=2912575 RepID=UPI001F237307|nr:Hsp20 family protein [Hyphobacterium sp. SN044]MCF8879937.1 Hsp20 family protein [Hyphobacterium sp. SN044]